MGSASTSTGESFDEFISPHQNKRNSIGTEQRASLGQREEQNWTYSFPWYRIASSHLQ